MKSCYGNNPITSNKEGQREINTNAGDKVDLVPLDRCLRDEISCRRVDSRQPETCERLNSENYIVKYIAELICINIVYV